ncbi:MAG: HAD family phosphatase [Muribaculaceae bacterium]|nr:HAD family phosphatase [Muribaculaceae bacterium]
MKEIKNIIFDLGGVVIDLQREMAVKALDRLGLKDSSALLGEYEQKGPFLMLEKGDISSSELYDILLPHCKPGTTCSDIRDAFEEFLKDLPVERLRMIEKLRAKGYKVYVLSNTNPIMYNHWIDNAFRNDGKSINDYFDGIVTSFQERTCKPDPEIFRRIVNRYNLNPEETILLDDSEANVNSAKSIGLQGKRIKPEGPDSFMSVCEKLLEKEAME